MHADKPSFFFLFSFSFFSPAAKFKVGRGKTSKVLDKTRLDRLFLEIDSPHQRENMTHEGGDPSTIQKTLVRFEFIMLLCLLSTKLYSDRAVDQAYHVMMNKNIVLMLNGVEDDHENNNEDETSLKKSASKKTGAKQKKKKKKSSSVPNSKKQLKEEKLLQVLMDPDHFREIRLYTREVNSVLQNFLSSLHKLFVRYSGSKSVLSGPGVDLFLHLVKVKESAKKRWGKLRKKRTAILKSARGKGGKGTLLKKKVIKKLSRGGGGGGGGGGTKSEKTVNEDMLKMMAPMCVREVNRADALIALAGYKPQDGKLQETLMPLENFLKMVHDLGLIGHGLSVREATWIFAWSLMHVKDELTTQHKRASLSFTDFLEAFSRLSEIFPLPTMNEMLETGSESVKLFLLQHKNLIIKAQKGATQRRASSNTLVVESKGRGLAEKIFILLSTLMDKIDADNVVSARMGHATNAKNIGIGSHHAF